MGEAEVPSRGSSGRCLETAFFTHSEVALNFRSPPLIIRSQEDDRVSHYYAQHLACQAVTGVQ